MSLLGGLRLPAIPLGPLSPPPTTAQPEPASPPPPDPGPAATVPPAPDTAAAAEPPAATAAAADQTPRGEPLTRLPAETAVRAVADVPRPTGIDAVPDALAEARRLALAAQGRFLMERLVERLAVPPMPAPALAPVPDRKDDSQRVAAANPALDLRR